MEPAKQSLFKKFTQGYTFKILMLIALVLLLLIPLAMIKGLIYERNRTANEAEEGVMEAWGSQLAEAGPVIALPGVKTTEVRTKTEREGETIGITNTPFTLLIAPRQLNITAEFKTEVRRRGIFSVPLFSGSLRLSGSFDPAPALASLGPDEHISLNQAELIIALSSQKGIRRIDRARWNSGELFFQPGNRGLNLSRLYTGQSSGIFAALPGFENSAGEFDITIAIQGGQFVRFLPVGQDTRVKIAADWASPSFQGSFLPNESNISDSGFDAVWDVSYLSRDIPLYWKAGDERDYSASLFGVNFFRAIDTYSLNTRAVKYAILFLIVPFLTLFLLEIFAGKRIHPIPYLLSGIANVVFYLLLLSLSEQMQFYFAYLAAASAVTVMMTLYSRSLLPSWQKSWYMGLVVLLSYVLLYAVLNAESYALLIGSVGTFIVVGLVMFLTRKLDWYGQDHTG
ncbi:MAG: cell envelope integrity protein CreD [Treponema sp.]|jgi:inner membrane protein|nr:cell envelope integrity protein CreD [Treponema sp.]